MHCMPSGKFSKEISADLAGIDLASSDKSLSVLNGSPVVGCRFVFDTLTPSSPIKYVSGALGGGVLFLSTISVPQGLHCSSAVASSFPGISSSLSS